MPRNHSYSLIEYYGKQTVNSCGYCKTDKGHVDHGMWAYYLNVQDYQDIINRGWRRSGHFCYKSSLSETCCPLYTLRCIANEFTLSKSQKRVMKRMNVYLTSGERKKGTTKSDEVSGNLSERSMDKTPMSEESSHNDIKTQESNGRVDNNKQGEPKLQPLINSPPLKTMQPEDKILGLSLRKGKSKRIRIERAIARLVSKGMTEEEASTQLRSKKKMPVKKSIEDLIKESDKENSSHKLVIRTVRSSPPSEEFESTFDAEYNLYKSYQVVIHKDPEEKCTKRQFSRFLVDSPLKPEKIAVDGIEISEYGSYHQQYWIDDEMIAVGVIDILPECVSSVYFFYNPKYSDLVLGTFSSLRELEFTRRLSQHLPDLKYYYLGFYVHNCRKMRYKARLQPSVLLCPETYTWIPIQQCQKMLDNSSYCRFNTDKEQKDVDDFASINDIIVMYKKVIMAYEIYHEKTKSEDTEQMKEYAHLIGNKAGHRILVVKR